MCMRGVCMMRERVVKGCEAELAGVWPQWSGCARHSGLDVNVAWSVVMAQACHLVQLCCVCVPSSAVWSCTGPCAQHVIDMWRCKHLGDAEG